MSRLNLSRIESQMVNLGLSQAQVAEKLGVSRESVSQWFQGSKYPRPASLLALGKLLGLAFQELVLVERDPLTEPQFAFRTNRKKAVKSQDQEEALDTARGLELLLPYLPSAPLTNPPTFAAPSLDKNFVIGAAQYLRTIISDQKSPRLSLNAVVGGLTAQGIFLIPVFWGPTGHDGLHIHLPPARRSFIYVNLDKKITDFRFWLLHEWVHALAPGMSPDEAEVLADLVPAEVLYPEDQALALLESRSNVDPIGLWVNAMLEEADAREISMVTIWKQIQLAASRRQISIPDIDIFPAEGKRLQSVPTVRQHIWGHDPVEIKDYIDEAETLFLTPIFEALSERIREKDSGPNFVERILRVPIGDAGGIHGYLSAR